MSKSKIKTKFARTAVMAIAATGLTATALALVLGSISEQKATAVNTSADNAPGSQISVVLPDIMALRIMNKQNSAEITSLDLELMPTPNGAFVKDSMLAEVSTSNVTGYKLYISTIGKDHTNAYTNALINQDATVAASVGTIPTLPVGANPTEAAYRVSSSAYRGTWGYSTNGLTITPGATDTDPPTITEVTDTSAITYNYFPVQGDSTVIRANSTSASKQLTPVTVGVNATSAVSAGTYNNIVEYTAVANPSANEYSVDFDANVTIEDMPTKITISSVASSETVTIPTTAPSRTGFAFKGWNTKADGTGTMYQPGDTITLTADDSDPTSSQVTLYAIWGAPGFWGLTYMQDMTPEICANTTTPARTAANADTDGSHDGDTNYVPQTTLTDSRDNKEYMVRKLADGNCWMSEDLKLNLGTYSAPVTVKRAQYNSTYTEDWTPTGTGGSNAAEPMNSNTKTPAPNGNYYYSWYAATAGSGTSAQTNTEAEYSICPSGWKLPANYTISTTKSYGSMTNAYGLTTNGANNTTTNTSTFEAFPLSFARTGYYNSGSPYYVGTYGLYWSSPAYSDATYAYYLFYGASYTYPQNDDGKYIGFTVRCVAL